ncbi:hypothetical protein AB205_0160970 [Aquarana catesbeiana]|uniref:Uncharacterized protein n=1 Tax=Aquarana catesbeiana TaxID=8400 RepID=A0A2G9S6N1_AQUCT|nr:hypothetical protein AB205_0160970 [Aquarana catesbeiana]
MKKRLVNDLVLIIFYFPCTILSKDKIRMHSVTLPHKVTAVKYRHFNLSEFVKDLPKPYVF